MGKTPLRPYGGTVRSADYAPRFTKEELIPLIGSKVNLGMITSLDPEDIPSEALTDASNVRIRYDKTSRRPGTILLDPAKPDSETVLKLYNFKRNSGDQDFIRFTALGLHKRGGVAWTPITGVLTGTIANRFSVVTAFDRLVFSNDGVDEIQVADSGVATFARLGNAPRYRYITAFANRIVGAYYNETGTENPAQVGWSADQDIDEWDPINDVSAGSGPLIESPGDLADFITGIQGFTNVLVITRERSIWLATKNPSASEPFNFFAAIPGIGCGCPHSIAVVPGGIAFADQRTQKVYVYTPGSEAPTSISTNIELDLFRAISDPLAVFGSFDNRNSEYSLAVPIPGTALVRVWTFNFRTQGWSYDERLNVSSIADVEAVGQELTIDDLVGTINGLIGTIDELENDSGSSTSRLYGRTDGEIDIERLSALDDSGVAYTSNIESKTFILPVTALYVARVRYEVYCTLETEFSLYYSKDGGNSWILARTDIITDLRKPIYIEWNKQVKTKRFNFRIETPNGAWDILQYEINVYQSGPTRADSPSTV